MRSGQVFENKFSKWCFKKGYFRKKLSATNDGGHKQKQDCDFIVANNEGVYFAELKSREERFSFNDLTQHKKLTLLERKTNKIIPLVLIYIQKEKTIVKLGLKDYDYIKNNVKFNNGKLKKSLTIKDVPDRFKFTWKNIDL